MAPRERLDSLTGLRALAALAVFASHIGPLFPDERFLTVAGRPVNAALFTTQGNVGVSFFFVLSGFVLAWSARPTGDSKRAFYGRRFARIYPLHLVTWTVWLGLTALGILTVTGWPAAIASLLLLQAWIPLLQRFLPIQPAGLIGNKAVYAVPNPPSWSLSCEAFFYALFPFTLAWMRRRWPHGSRSLAYGAVAVTVAVPVGLRLLQPRIGKEAAEYLSYAFPPVRMLEFITGMAIALVVASGRWRRAPLGWSLLLLAVAYAADARIPRPMAFVAVTLVPFVLVIVAAAGRDLAGRPTFWSHRIVRYAGEVSFAFYLSQYAVIDLVTRWWPGGSPSYGRALAMAVVAFLATALVAMALHHGVERPSERWLRGRLGGSAAPRANDVAVWSSAAEAEDVDRPPAGSDEPA